MNAAEALENGFSTSRLPSLGPAMRFVLALAGLRGRHRQPTGTIRALWAGGAGAVALPPLALMWELAERYHPEQAWLAESWVRGERSLEEIERTAPRESLAPALLAAARLAPPDDARAFSLGERQDLVLDVAAGRERPRAGGDISDVVQRVRAAARSDDANDAAAAV